MPIGTARWFPREESIPTRAILIYPMTTPPTTKKATTAVHFFRFYVFDDVLTHENPIILNFKRQFLEKGFDFGAGQRAAEEAARKAAESVNSQTEI